MPVVEPNLRVLGEVWCIECGATSSITHALSKMREGWELKFNCTGCWNRGWIPSSVAQHWEG